MCLAYSGRTNEHQVGGFLEEVGVKKLHDLVSWNFGIESPVEIAEEFDPTDSRNLQQIGDSFFLSGFVFLREESFKEGSFVFAETFQVLEKSKMFPTLRQVQHSRQAPFVCRKSRVASDLEGLQGEAPLELRAEGDSGYSGLYRYEYCWPSGRLRETFLWSWPGEAGKAGWLLPRYFLLPVLPA